jgi:hypothetical protein
MVFSNLDIGLFSLSTNFRLGLWTVRTPKNSSEMLTCKKINSLESLLSINKVGGSKSWFKGPLSVVKKPENYNKKKAR